MTISAYKITHWAISLCLVAIMSVWCVSAMAADVIGRMVWVKGQVTASGPDKRVRALQRESTLAEGDILATGSDGGGQVVFSDGSLLSLRHNTTLKLSKYNYKKGQVPQRNSQVMELFEGGFRTVTGIIAHSHVEGYTVKTPVATIGVRGTDYSAVYSNAAGLQVKLDKGAIDLTNNAGSVTLDKKTSQIFAQIKTVTQMAIVSDTVPTTFNALPAPVAATPPAAPVASNAEAALTQSTTQDNSGSENSSGAKKTDSSDDVGASASGGGGASGGSAGGTGTDGSSPGASNSSGSTSTNSLSIDPSGGVATSSTAIPAAPSASGFCIY